MSRRRKIDYLAVFKKIIEIVEKETGEKPKVKKIMADFEIALWQAIRTLKSENYLPDIIMKGCFFHFCQATFRKVMNYNLKKDYFNEKDSGTRVYIKWLMSLPLLPVPQMLEAFSSLENNNLNYKIQKTNVDFYELLGHLGEEAKWLNFQVRSLISDKLSPLKTKKQKNFEELLKENWEKLDKSHLTAIQFLHEINNMKYGDDLINESWSLNFSRVDLEPEEEDLEEQPFQEHEAELSC